MILQHANNSFHLKVLWPHISTKILLVCKLQFFCFQTFWHSCFRIFVPFWHHDSNYMPVSLSAFKKTSKSYSGYKYLLLCFDCASQRLTEFQFRKDPFWFPVMLDWRKGEIASPIAHIAKSFYIYAFMFMSINTLHRLHFLVNVFFFEVNGQRYQQFTAKDDVCCCVSRVVWFVCIHLCTKSWFGRLDLALAGLQVLLAKISCVIKTFELRVLCNISFYLQWAFSDWTICSCPCYHA